MEYLVTAKQMRLLEGYAMEELGIMAPVLMERAAVSMAEEIEIRKKKKRGLKVLIACGNGNNGADGYALARVLLERDYEVFVWQVLEPVKQSELNQLQQQIVGKLENVHEKLHFYSYGDGECITSREHLEYDIVVDAILGIGVSRPLSDSLLEIVSFLNRLGGYKIALDQATGIHTDSGEKLREAFRADCTVTFGMKKTGLVMGDGKVYSGEVVTYPCAMNYVSWQTLKKDDFSLEENYFTKCLEQNQEQIQFALQKEDAIALLQRNPLGNKGTFGKIGILAGSKEVGGAPLLCTKSAFQVGGGYIRLYTHCSNRDMILSSLPETVLSLYEESDENDALMKEFFDFSKVIAIGPGMGLDQQALKRFLALLAQYDSCELDKLQKPLVLDADALTLWAKHDKIKDWVRRTKVPIICTPHLMEFARLTNLTISQIKEKRIELARAFAVDYGVTLVLKDATTVIAHKDGNVVVNTTGNDGMAVAGSGDVLCGMIAGLLGQGLKPFMAASLAVYLHGLAGEYASNKMGKHSMRPSDLIDGIQGTLFQLMSEDC